MEQSGNSINRNSGSHLISDQDHMGEVLERLQNTQQQGAGEQSRGQQQQGSDRKNENRTRQSY